MTPRRGARVSRRRFLGMLGAGVAAAGASSCGPFGLDTPTGQTGELLRSAVALPARFRVPLPVPAVAAPVATDDGRDLYEIRQRLAQVEILPGKRTEIWGYDGTFPGPTIEARRGRPVVVRHINELPLPTVVHLHGGHTPPEHDGWPLDLVLPAAAVGRHAGGYGGALAGHRPEQTYRGSFDYRYPMEQRAATL